MWATCVTVNVVRLRRCLRPTYDWWWHSAAEADDAARLDSLVCSRNMGDIVFILPATDRPPPAVAATNNTPSVLSVVHSLPSSLLVHVEQSFRAACVSIGVRIVRAELDYIWPHCSNYSTCKPEYAWPPHLFWRSPYFLKIAGYRGGLPRPPHSSHCHIGHSCRPTNRLWMGTLFSAARDYIAMQWLVGPILSPESAVTTVQGVPMKNNPLEKRL